MLNRNPNPKYSWRMSLCALCIPFVLLQSGDVFERRMSYISTLSESERRELKDKYERFKKLSPEDLAHVRKMHDLIHSKSNAKELQSVLSKYHDWLKTLRPQVRTEVQSLEVQQRIDQIRFIQVKQHQKTYGIEDEFRLPSVDDTSLVYKWLRYSIMKNRRSERFKKHREKVSSKRYLSMAEFLELVISSEEMIELFFPIERLNELYEDLSDESKLILEQLRNDQERLELVMQWCRSVVKRRVTEKQRLEAYRTLKPDQKVIVDGMSTENRRYYLDRVYWNLKLKRRN